MRQSHQGLWDVQDLFLQYPDEKLRRESSPLVEVTLEAWGHGQFDNAPVPEGLVQFVCQFVNMLGIVPSQLSSVEDLCRDTLMRLDYEQPYFCLVDCLVQLSHNELTNTYRHRQTGTIIDPARTETFKLEPNWDFKPYNTIKKMMEHPGMTAFLKQDVLPPNFASRDAAMVHILEKVSEVVYGPFGWFEEFVDTALESFRENLIFDSTGASNEKEAAEIEFCLQRDRLFWMAGTLAVMTWLKSPKALTWLAQFHVIYEHLLDEQEDGRLIPRKGVHEVIICGAEIYTHLDLEFVPNRAPDTCVCCNTQTHCTKRINLTAIEHPFCSCGKEVSPTDPVEYGFPAGHYYNSKCIPYNTAHPPRVGYVCQRCIFSLVRKLPGNILCGRATCPAINCPHHMGAAARLRALTQQRTNQLTAPPPR